MAELGALSGDVPTPDSEAIVVADVVRLIELLDLSEVRFYELSAASSDEGEPDESADSAAIKIRTAHRKRPNGLDYRVEIEIPRPTGYIRVDAAAIYVAPTDFDLADDVMLDFGDNVAMMAVIPFLRQAIADLAQRFGDSVVLPMLGRGALSFRNEGAPEIRDSEAAVAEPDLNE